MTFAFTSELRELNTVKDRFLATTSHELRTPLNGVIGMASLLAETKLDSEQAEYVQGIQQSGETLLHTVNDILDICKMRANKFTLDIQEFDLLERIERVLDMASPFCLLLLFCFDLSAAHYY